LGNVLVTVSDRRIQGSINNDTVNYYKADIASANDYYPFGMVMPGRTTDTTNRYRYGFNGKEKDKNVSSLTDYDYGYRVYSSAIGKFLSVDPLTEKYPWYTPYQFAGNKPIQCIDLDGAEEWAKNYLRYSLQQAQLRVIAEEKLLRDRQGYIRTSPPPNWKMRWQQSTNFFARISYSVVNGVYTTSQQLSSGFTGQEQIENIGSGSYPAHGYGGEKQRTENFVNGATAFIPSAEAERTGVGVVTDVLKSKTTNEILLRTEMQVVDDAPLLSELTKQGVKYTAADVLKIGKNVAGKIIFLEKGGTTAGLKHILEHSDDFVKAGIAKSDIENVVFEAATSGKLVGSQGGRPIFQILYNGQTKNIAVTVGDNGYIVGANPAKIK
jgi:RHS repeat-associated protein